MRLFVTLRTYGGVESLWGMATQHRAAQEREVKRATEFSDKGTTYRIVELTDGAAREERIRLLTENIRQRDEMIAGLRAQLEKRATDRPPAPTEVSACECIPLSIHHRGGTEVSGRVLCDACLAAKASASEAG